MVQIQNEFLQVQIAHKGAELMSVFDKIRSYQWLWQGDPSHWSKRAPVLFPFIGCVKGGEYLYQDTVYSMSKHGFARDMDFELESADGLSATFILKSNDSTQSMYPFDFELKIKYSLENQVLKVYHELRNLGTKTMIFSLGAHPAFNCPMDTEDWTIHFEQPEDLESRCIDLENGLVRDELKLMGRQIQSLPLSRALFAEDALVFEGLKSEKVVLEGPSKDQRLSFKFEGFPIMAFWTPSATRAPFICLEPWFGIADLTDHNGHLEDKYGCVRLEAEQCFGATLEIATTGE